MVKTAYFISVKCFALIQFAYKLKALPIKGSAFSTFRIKKISDFLSTPQVNSSNIINAKSLKSH